MPIADLFSSRAKPVPDVWIYDAIPDRLRVQVSNIILGAYGDEWERYSADEWLDHVAETVCHEHGITALNDERKGRSKISGYLLHGRSLEIWLDIVELCFRILERSFLKLTPHDRSMRNITIPAEEGIRELNERFKRAGFGFRFEKGTIIRIDSEHLHAEATIPALRLLSDPRFAGADAEFRAAHAHLREGQHKDCAVDALNALESTMKAICAAKAWEYPKGARAADLLSILRTNGLFPEFAEKSADQLIATLKSGLPSVRNDAGGHGQGPVPIDVPEYVASYALNLAASKIRLLVEAFLATDRPK